MDYVIGEFIYMIPRDMNLQIGKVKNYYNNILISSPSFKIGTNLKINLNEGKDKPHIKCNKEHKQDVKMMKTEPDTNKITYEEEKVDLVLGITSIFTLLWMFK